MAKGQKTCPQCSNTMGPRTKTCKCGHNFTFKTKTETVAVIKTKDAPTVKKIPRSFHLCLMPAIDYYKRTIGQPCPVMPRTTKNPTEVDFLEWLENIKEFEFIRPAIGKTRFSRTAIASFARLWWPVELVNYLVRVNMDAYGPEDDEFAFANLPFKTAKY